MPSPVGHAIAAVAIGWAVAPAPDGRRVTRLAQAATFAAIGVAPDLDLLIGRHSAETHSIGAALVVASLAAWRLWPSLGQRARLWTAVCLAWLSHPLLDTLALDTSPPLGVMLFWPFEWGYHQTGWSIFAPISRRYWLPGFVMHNTLAVLREVALLAPMMGVAAYLRRGRFQPARPAS